MVPFLTKCRVLAIPYCLRHTRRSWHVSDRHTCRRRYQPLFPRQTCQRCRDCYDRRLPRWNHLSAAARIALLESWLGLGYEDTGFCLPCSPGPCESAHPCPSSTIAWRQYASESKDLPPASLRPSRDCRLLPRMGPIRPGHISDQLLS